MHYPYTPSKIIGMGENGNYELGNDNCNSYSKPVELADFEKKVEKIFCTENFTVVLTQDKEIYYCGYKSSFERTNQKLEKYHKKLPSGEIKKMTVGGSSIILVMDDGKIYFEGRDSYFHFYSSYTDSVTTFKHKSRPDEEEESIVDIDCG